VPYVTVGQQYAAISDLTTVVSAAALAHPTTSSSATQNAALLRASEEIDGYLRDQFTLPLKQWGSDIVQKSCDIAAYRLICLRGFNPELDGSYLDNYKLAVSWLKDVAAGKVVPDVQDSSPNGAPGVPSSDAQPEAVTASPINCSTGNSTRGTSRR